MSNSARKRGAGRATRGQQPAETASRRGDRQQAGGFDGPASRGSGSQSGPGTAGRGAGSTAPSAESATGSPGAPAGGFEAQAPTSSSHRSSQSGGPEQTQPQAAAPLGDPARDRPPRFTDQMRNVDLPPSFYNIDQLVSHSPSILCCTIRVCHPGLQ
ncbi:hypothetical protein G647_04911 [Cladophialophora carrionii CBS 160.54]|uniref:Uncharacterized protein n=1 Tax=Cladophialophora carrionii CBS 160.54 TaxID=1279043 RepID=V9D869_9EURO|nr:uncharacterized protein G647_04911 [Cladophialophora carrionii CBS 160.54]ETI23114.1 hypothetical protein G647_04911 [Cladophialophora carrionii CBS 160.54]